MKIWKNLVKTECCSHEESTSLNFRQLFGNFRRHSLKYQDGLPKRSSSKVMRFAFHKLPQSHRTKNGPLQWPYFFSRFVTGLARPSSRFWFTFGCIYPQRHPPRKESPCKRLSRTKTCAVRAGRYILTSILA